MPSGRPTWLQNLRSLETEKWRRYDPDCKSTTPKHYEETFNFGRTPQRVSLLAGPALFHPIRGNNWSTVWPFNRKSKNGPL